MWTRISCMLPILMTQILAVSDAAPQLRVAAATTPSTTTDDLTQYVHPFVGTDRSGFAFPAATMPFGMVQWSPDTPTRSPGGYIYGDSTIKGFSLTHLSGTGCSIYQDIPFMPFVGSLDRSPATSPSTYVSSVSHAGEQAMPGYYKVHLGSGVQVELTVTPRTGFGRVTYPASTTAQMLINVGGSVNGDSDASAQIVGNDKVTGSASSTGFCGRATPYTVYFAAQFSRPFTGFGTWHGATSSPGATTTRGGQTGAYVTFDTTQYPAVLVKVGVSFVSVQNAVLNLRTEHPSPLTSAGFDAVHTAAGATWNAMLSRIHISGGTAADKQTFYTALYHALLHPNVFSDVNGQYPGFDNQVHSTQAYTQYANYSGWDIYRTEIPLLALLVPRETGDMMQSLWADARDSGGWPGRSVGSMQAA